MFRVSLSVACLCVPLISTASAPEVEGIAAVKSRIIPDKPRDARDVVKLGMTPDQVKNLFPSQEYLHSFSSCRGGLIVSQQLIYRSLRLAVSFDERGRADRIYRIPK